MIQPAGLPTVDIEMLRENLAGTPPNFDGWHTTHDDRTQVNKLIRDLRRARDQAFGRDE